MEEHHPDASPQMENQTLDVHDEQKGTRGGPPGWMALAIVGGIFLVVGAVVVIASLLAT